MQTSTSLIYFLIVLTLAGCTTNPVPEEEFEGPAGNFPRLVDVPDRPKLPDLNPQKKIDELEDDNKNSNIIKDLTLRSSSSSS